MTSSTFLCNYCGCGIIHSSSTTTTQTSFQSHSDELAFINDKIARLQNQIDVLRSKQAPFLQRLNDIQAPVHSLPPEVLSHIIKMDMDVHPIKENAKRQLPLCKLCDRDEEYLLHPINYGSVSSYWRKVSHSTPRLWTSFQMKIVGRVSRERMNKKLAFLRHYFERAANLSLTICFDSKLYAWPDMIRAEDNADEYTGDLINSRELAGVLDIVLQERAKQIKALHINGVPISWLHQLREQDRNYTQLEALSISDISHHLVQSFMIPVIPTLQYLSIVEAPVARLSASCNRITCLHLSNISKDDGLTLLLDCRETLIEYMVREVYTNRSHVEQLIIMSALPTDIISIIPYLETFRWEFSNEMFQEGIDEISPLDKYVLYKLDMPSLRNISLSKLNLSDGLITSPNLLTRTRQVLESVEIFGREKETKAGLKTLFGMFDTRKLTINDFGGETSLILVIKALTGNCLPSLTLLSLQDGFCYPGLDSEILANIALYSGKFYFALLLMVEQLVNRINNSMIEAFSLEAHLYHVVALYRHGYRERWAHLLDSGRFRVVNQKK